MIVAVVNGWRLVGDLPLFTRSSILKHLILPCTDKIPRGVQKWIDGSTDLLPNPPSIHLKDFCQHMNCRRIYRVHYVYLVDKWLKSELEGISRRFCQEPEEREIFWREEQTNCQGYMVHNGNNAKLALIWDAFCRCNKGSGPVSQSSLSHKLTGYEKTASL